MEKKPKQDDTENSITLNDLVVLRNIVHIASRRGAFSAEEFSDIGTVYNKVDKFLKKILKKILVKNRPKSLPVICQVMYLLKHLINQRWKFKINN